MPRRFYALLAVVAFFAGAGAGFAGMAHWPRPVTGGAISTGAGAPREGEGAGAPQGGVGPANLAGLAGMEERGGALTDFGPQLARAREYACRLSRAIAYQAAQRYYLDHGGWPAALGSLVPDYLDAPPNCPGGGRLVIGPDGQVECTLHDAGK